MSMATRDGCLLFHMWPAMKTKPPAKNSGGGTSGARHVPPSNRSNKQTGKPRNTRGTGNRTQRQQQQQQRQ
jgi:hypothetical protein